MEKIPVFKPVIDSETISHITDCLEMGWLGMGSVTKEFEERLTDWLGLKDRYVVATNTGTSALHLALVVAGVGKGDEVIVPSFDYVADHQAIKMTGAEVVLCDINGDNLGIDCDKAEQLITDRTKAIIPLHFAGLPCELNSVYSLAKKYKLRVIEDSMHAFGTYFEGQKLGSFGDISCFSFDPVKIITSIDGGCVVVNSESEMERLRHLRFLGVDKETAERYKNSRSWEYDVIDQGYRYHLTNVLASIGISQIKRVDEFISSRQKICKKYNEAFSSIDEIIIPATDFNNISPFIYYIRVKEEIRESLIHHLQSSDIDIGINFLPTHKHSYFSDCIRSDMSITEKVSKEILTLPLHSLMNEEHLDRIITSVVDFFIKR